MDGREHESLSDEALEREIEAALAVDPSPEFLARVRARVEKEEGRAVWPLRWQWVVGTVFTAAAALLVVYVSREPEPAAVNREPAPIAVVRPQQLRPQPDVKLPALTAPAITRRQPAPPPVRPPAPEVLISEEERSGFQLLLATLSKEKDAKQLGDALAKAETSGPPWLEISPIVIEPFSQFTVSEGDAQ
jgi:hypothetical protein